jgi:hypothetical protein
LAVLNIRLLTGGAPGSCDVAATPFTQLPLLILWTTATSSVRVSVPPLLNVTDDWTKLVDPRWTVPFVRVVPPVGAHLVVGQGAPAPHETASIVIMHNKTKPAMSFFMIVASSFLPSRIAKRK